MVAIGMVLRQKGRPIPYFSEKLNKAQKKYSIMISNFMLLQKCKMIGCTIYFQMSLFAHKPSSVESTLHGLGRVLAKLHIHSEAQHRKGEQSRRPLSRRVLILTTIRNETVGFQQIKDLYDKEFAQITKTCRNLALQGKTT
jgi:hypothetical protein